MPYMPGTPWFNLTTSELELEFAAGRLQPASRVDEPAAQRFRPAWALASVLGLELAIAVVARWPM